jgi:hypothetical protein
VKSGSSSRRDFRHGAKGFIPVISGTILSFILILVYILKPPCSTFENFEANLQYAKQKIVLGIPSLQWKG